MARVDKARICIRIDRDNLDYFMAKAQKLGGKVGYQTLLNNVLRRYIDTKAALERIARDRLYTVVTAPRSGVAH